MRSGLIIAIFLLIIALFLPQIASTSWGKPLFVKILEAKSRSKIEIGSLHLSWRGPQQFQQLTWTQRNASGAIEELDIRAPLWSFSGPFHLKNGSISIQGIGLILETLSLQGDILKKPFREHAITLRDPLIAPFRLTNIEAHHPLTLQIEPAGFSLPLPYAAEKLEVGRATLNLDKIRCKKGKSVTALFALLKATRLSKDNQMNVWCTPLSFHIHKGIVETERMDALLADSIHICTWGHIDLIKDQIDMVLGLPADTLQQFFGIKHLPKNYVLQIAIRGSIQEPEIVKGPALAKIAALIAAGQLSKKGLLGNLAKPLFSLPEEKEAPPPQHPFPWEN